ncbi:hypothetical protein [Nonomuraea candida]|uniref:hypothetical protein n=1 Tax=Nonomuraea candida TaxID=359159 RepID=UPI0005BD379A|nr:hypothetical protein [Nonomuraea candida]
MELKAEITTRAERRRTVRRLFTGAAIAGLAAAAAIAVPLLTGTEQPAYAVAENADGTINVQLNEFRDADKLEQDLKEMKVTADITYLKPGKSCRADRGKIIGGGSPEEWEGSASDRAVRLLPQGGITIDPRHVGDGRTLVMAFTEKRGQAPRTEKPEVKWQFSAYVVEGQVKPCVVVDDPLWGDAGGSGRPPAGS